MTDPTPNAHGSRPASQPPGTPPDLVVGLGASAGGLEALQPFFVALPPDTGLAYVVVQHLDPATSTLLPDLLAKVTAMPVAEARDGAPVLRDHVYVAPAQAIVRLEGDVLRVTPAAGDELRTPVNDFFFSLADARQTAAVAVVLSGNGTDGAYGLKAVSDAGGMTMAQDPATARHDTMPRNAATLGPADRVLPPEKMPEDLLAYARHVRALAAAGEGETLHHQIAESLGAICEVLLKETDHNFKHYKTSTLVRRVGRRMQIHRIASADRYVERLREDSDEVAALFKELLIGVTAFFRDPEAFDVLAQQVLPQLFENRGPKDPVRLWVPGCATGEEAYTLAMLVRERLNQFQHPPEVQIFATDINERALAVARQGAYPLGIAEDVSADRLKRFFLKKGSHYHVVKEVRELCLFSAHDLIRDPPFSRLDLISCRNLLIYLGPHLQKKLIPLFHYALRPGGYLFLGPSETISTHRDLFRPVDVKHRISQRLPTAVRSAFMLGPAEGYRVGTRPPEGAVAGEPDLHLVMQRIVLDEFAPKSVVVTEDGQIVCASGGLERYLGIAAGTFRNNVIKLARTGLRVGLRSALSESIKTSRTVVHDGITTKTENDVQRVRLTVQPMPQFGEQSGLYLIVFQDAGPAVSLESRPHTASTEEADALIDQLERELRTTREDLEKTIQDLEATNEELKSSNEELLSMNEELQSANEELETSKEEIQSGNEALARSNADLENLLTSTQIATLFLDDELRIQRFTPAMASVYNLIATDVGRSLADITHRTRAMPPLPPTREVHHVGRPVEDEVETTDGRWFIRRVLPYRTHHGQPEGLVVTFTDVTDLKAIQARARELGELLKVAPVLVRDLEDRIVFWDRGAEEMYGFTPAEAIGRVSHELLRTTFPRPFEELLAELLRVGSWEGELTHHRKDGSEIDVLCRWVFRAGEGDRPGAILVVSADITDRKRMEAALRAADRQKNDFLAMLAHELRNPLAPVLNANQVLRLRGPADPATRQQRDLIDRQIGQMKRLLDDLLDVARITRGTIQVQKEPVDLRTVLETAVEAARPLMAAKDHDLQVSLPELPLVLEGDATRLTQVFTNLLANAAKYTDRGGRVWLTAVAEPSEDRVFAAVSVRDTGMGMTQEVVDRAFDLFSQADQSLDRAQGGLGIGLTLVKRLVERHGGTVEARSEGPGKGSEFVVRLPLDPGAVLPQRGPRPTEPAAARRLRILVVDDNVDSADSLALLLGIWEHDVVTANDGPSALEVAQAFRPEVVFLDIGLPRMNGYQVAREMRKSPDLARVLLVAVTGYGQEEDRQKAREAGFDVHLMKPVDPDEILAVLARVLAAGS
ncbi:MAG TPA: CheR family methyltransferase [Gemmataceae bacterium]|nr:CheR family methyltransferase [Gemmataceae bacterium]